MIQDESFAFLIIECHRNMFGIAENLTRVAQNSLKQWTTELTAGNQVFQGEVCIKRGIFQGDSLSPLLFILTLILLTLVLRKVKAGSVEWTTYNNSSSFHGWSKALWKKWKLAWHTCTDTVCPSSWGEDIRMELGIEKWAVLVVKRAKLVKSESIVTPRERLHDLSNEWWWCGCL